MHTLHSAITFFNHLYYLTMATEIRPKDSVSQDSAALEALPGIPQYAQDHGTCVAPYSSTLYHNIFVSYVT